MKKFINHLSKIISTILLIVVLLISYSGKSQTCTISLSNPGSITVCDNPETITITVINSDTIPMENNSMLLTLPTGIQYSVGSLSEATSFNVQESNTTNLSAVTFTSNTLPVGDTIIFSVDILAKMDAIDYVLAGNTLRNQLTDSFNGGSSSQTSGSYNLYYGVLNFTTISPSSYSIYSGETYQRTLTLTNSGNGRISSFKILDTHNSSIAITSVNNGTLNGGGSEISFTATDFHSVGNNDDYFDQGESITVVETIQAAGCESGTVESVINSSWGCDSQRQGTDNHAYTTIDLATPTLSVSTSEELSTCFGSGDASTQSITLTNNGQGIAKNVQLDIYKSLGSGYDQYIFSRIDETSITYSLNGGSSTSITPTTTYTTYNSGDYSCLGSNPIGRVILDLPDLESGSSIIVYFETYHCNIDVSRGDKVEGWGYQVDYEDYCGLNNYSKSGTGQNDNNTYMYTFNETPTDINGGETKEFNFTIDSYHNDLPQGPGARYKVVFTMDDGLSFSSLELYNNVEWPAHSLAYNLVDNSVTATYELPAPSDFNLSKAVFNLKLTGDCQASGGSQSDLNTVMDMYYITDTTCMNEIPFVSDETVQTSLHCPSTSCEGVDFYEFTVARTSLGQPDNDQNGLPDASGSLDYSRIKLNRVMYGDTMKCVFKGIVHTSEANPSWSYAYATSAIDNGINLTEISADVSVYDSSTASYLTCSSVPVSQSNSENTKNLVFNLSPANLAANCGTFSGFTYNEGDSITLTAYYKVSANIGSDIQTNTIQNDFYMSNVANPSGSEQYSCDWHDGRFTLIGYYFDNEYTSYYNITDCEQTIAQNFYFSVGSCCSNYAGGNLFPSEYRNWAHLKKATVNIPMYYELTDAYIKFRRTVKTGVATSQYVYNLQPESVSGYYYTYDLEQFYKAFGGDVYYSDDGFNGTLYITIAPTSDAPHGEYQDMDWAFQFERGDFLGGGSTEWVEGDPDRVKFSPSQLSVTSNNPTVDGIDKTVTWDLKVRNTSSSSTANNAWIHLNNPSGDISIDYLIDDDTDDTLSLSGDIYQIDVIEPNETRDFSVIAHYTNCYEDFVTAYAGYQCSGYPNSFGEFTGDVYSTGLYVDPQPASWQASITGDMVGDACGHSCEVYLTLTNVHFATIDNIDITLTPVGNSLTFQTGTAEILYPSTSSYTSTSDPATSGSNYVFHLADLNQDIADNGLLGISHSTYNTVKLHFSMTIDNDFENGDYLLVSYSGNEICGNTLPALTSAFDPSIGFESVTGSGLTDDQINSWSASWADYNNDGYDDLFVTTYDENQANYLYKNNGDGSFTRITTGDIATDKASSLAASWADYNNDGYIDLFVANNIGSYNFLYKNNGDGTFSKITNSPVVTEGIYCHSASWADYDNDGYVDLFVAEYFPTKTNHLFHNKGDGTFTTVEGNPVVTDAGHSIGAAWGDYNNDGLIDLFVPNTNGDKNYLYKNIGNGQFVKVDENVLSTPSKSVGCSWADYNNDGYLDLFITNAGEEDNFLYKNNGDGTFTKITTGDIVNDGGNSHGSCWIDIENDGDLDLYVTNDQDGDNFMYKNNGDGTFTKLENDLTTVGGNSFGVAKADYDNDGDYDLFVANHENTENFFFKNTKGQCSNFLCMKLVGTNSNYSAIGARVKAKATINGTPVWQMHQITSQSGGGSSSENSLKVIFGMDDATTVDSLVIDWPSGYRQVYTNVDISGGSCGTYVEENGGHVSGKAYVDANENGQYDNGETLLKNVKISVDELGIDTYTNEQGEYSYYLNDGSYTLSQEAPTYYSLFSPGDNGTYSVTISGTGESYPNKDFGYTASGSQPDLYINISTTMLRKGFTNDYTINYQNNGTTTAYNDTLMFVLAEGLEPVSATVDWDDRNSDTLYWFLSSIPPQTNQFIYLTDMVGESTTIGEYVTCSAEISSGTTDANYSDNTDQDNNMISGAIDPNDKLVFPPDRVSPGEYLTYKIRFQNVGNYPAENVVVYDTLSPDLDINTLCHIATSHPSQLTIIENHILRWEFSHINLPDSVHNEPNSHGYVQFKIKPVDDLPYGRGVDNRACIVFDYYQKTPTNNTHIVVKNDFYYDGVSEWSVFPNPTKGDLFLNYVSKEDTEAQIYLTTLLGEKVYTKQATWHKGWNKEVIKTDKLARGTYMLFVQTATTTSSKRIMVIK